MTSASDQKDAEANPTRLTLSLSDFTLIEVFEGSYPLGERSEGFFTVEHSDCTRNRPPTRYPEQEPSHKFVVKAKWKYEWRSEKLVLSGEEVDPGILEMQLANDRKHGDLSQGRHDFLVIYVPEAIFTPLVSAVHRGEIEQATLHLDADDAQETRCRLIFKTLHISHREAAPSITVSKLLSEFRGTFRQVQLCLYAIIFLLVLVLLTLRH